MQCNVRHKKGFIRNAMALRRVHRRRILYQYGSKQPLLWHFLSLTAHPWDLQFAQPFALSMTRWLTVLILYSALYVYFWQNTISLQKKPFSWIWFHHPYHHLFLYRYRGRDTGVFPNSKYLLMRRYSTTWAKSGAMENCLLTHITSRSTTNIHPTS